MPKKAPTAKAKEAKTSTTTNSGVVLEGDVITGADNKLSQKEQGQLARGEVDENLEPTSKGESKPLPGSPGDVKTVKVAGKLYQGWITAEATAAATGEQVSVKWNQAEPTTEDGLFHSFLAYHPSAIRDTFKVDPENKIDPTKRTYLERST